jgi:hypothetical protein
MGVCQTRIPCSQEIKSKIESQTIINNYINKDISENQNQNNNIIDDQKVSNEEIKIAIPSRAFSSTKISSRNILNKKLNEDDSVKDNRNLKIKSLNMTTTKTPSTQQNNNTRHNDSNENNIIYNIKKINKIEINNFGIDNLNKNLNDIKILEKKNNMRCNSQGVLNCLISNDKKDKIKNENNSNIKVLHNIDNNVDKIENNNRKNENKNFSYENLQIEDIISEEKIHTKNNHEVVFRGNLLFIDKIGETKNQMIYCVLSRIRLKLYKDINYFLRMKKPLYIIDLHLINNIHISKDDSLGLYFSLLDKYIFSSKNKDQLFKWIVVLNYFSSKLRK